MKNLAVIFLLVVVSFAGCRSGSGGPPQGDPSLVVSHHYELVIDGTAYFRQDEVHPGFIQGGNTGAWS